MESNFGGHSDSYDSKDVHGEVTERPASDEEIDDVQAISLSIWVAEKVTDGQKKVRGSNGNNSIV